MRLNTLFCAVFILLHCTWANVWAQNVRGIKILDYGIYHAKIVEKVDTEKTATGDRNIIETTGIIKRTTDIPASVGTRFGILYVVEGEPSGETVELKKITIYPKTGLKNPHKKGVVYKSEYAIEAEIGIEGHSGYGFDYEWEAVPGEWMIQLWYKGKKLAEKTFTVRKP